MLGCFTASQRKPLDCPTPNACIWFPWIKFRPQASNLAASAESGAEKFTKKMAKALENVTKFDKASLCCNLKVYLPLPASSF